MNLRTVGVALSGVGLLGTGCGGSDDAKVDAGQARTEETTTTLPPETTTQPPTTLAGTTTTAKAATTTTAGSILRRRDTRPGDVKDLAEYYLGGPPSRGFDCVFGNYDLPGPVPTLYVDAKLVLGEATTICPQKFTGTADITVQVSRGATKVWSATVSPRPAPDQQVPGVTFATLPGDATGTYTVTATQGTLKATGMFVVDYAVNQHILVVAESPGRGVASVARGKPVHIGLAGWKAGQTVQLSLHYSSSLTPGGDAKFITTFPVTVDAKGQRLYELGTRADDPRGCYAVNTRPAEEPQGALGRLGPTIVAFCLT